LRVARTPLERIRALARGWAHSLAESGELATVALRAQLVTEHVAALSALGSYVATVLESEVESRGALPGLSDRARVVAVAAVFDSVSRSQLSELPNPDELALVLADLAIRLLR
jgi:hypothetical protein